jgi:ribonuclease P protein component
MLLGVLHEQGDTPTRVGLITSRRVGNAVQRNLVRRRLREIVRLARPILAGGIWIVIIAKASAARASYQSIAEEWTQLARKAGCFRP